MLVPTWEDFSHIQGSIGWLFPLLHTCDYSGPYEIAPIYDPTQRRPSPKPVQVDLRKAFIIGICCWVVALIVSIVVFSTAHSEMSRQSMFICSYGVLIGFALLVWEHFHRRDYRRLGAD